MRTLVDLKPGQSGIVKKLHGRGPLKRRFNDMGVVSGTPIEVTKVAPLGDPIQITVKEYELTIRKADAVDIEID
mgnify:CR=1 FL=1